LSLGEPQARPLTILRHHSIERIRSHDPHLVPCVADDLYPR
jgi:hypothetical protein